jgi:hypothetical protein
MQRGKIVRTHAKPGQEHRTLTRAKDRCRQPDNRVAKLPRAGVGGRCRGADATDPAIQPARDFGRWQAGPLGDTREQFPPRGGDAFPPARVARVRQQAIGRSGQGLPGTLVQPTRPGQAGPCLA